MVEHVWGITVNGQLVYWSKRAQKCQQIADCLVKVHPEDEVLIEPIDREVAVNEVPNPVRRQD